MTTATVDLFDLDRFADGPPHELFRRLRAEQPVCFLPEPAGPGYWGVFGYDDVVTVSRHPDRFGSHPNTMIRDPAGGDAGAGALMLNQDPPRHTQLRKLVNRGFTPRQVATLTPRVQAIVDRLLDGVAARGRFDLVADVAVELPLQVIAELVGVPEEDRHRVFAWTERMMSLDDPELGGTEADAHEAIQAMFAYADRLAAERAGGGGSDLLSVLLAAEVEGERLGPHDVDLFFLLLMNAGSETTRNLITGGTLALFEHPSERARLQRDLDLVPSAVEEMLRFVTPVLHFRRTAREDTELGGQHVRAGDKVVVWYASANRDEAQFPNADRFDIMRAPNDHVAFGAGGPHFCLGAGLARLEARLLFQGLLRRFPDLCPDGPVRRLRSNFINGIKSLPVAVTAAPGPADAS
ncbi:MAG TPA: cytochrome P450 [Acidimicrobiia bacterium]|nr:cytochrome P450 [Acidimicrobiia bacterium]HEV3450300.1 cytochrome P450 [Acidimicrobiia bacterium]